ncbi:MAG: tetratricopeptide repeat protein [Patescibacteria group bacterium]|nr:tetratricopeptide repeat protein [Patescibacteria group bacterium]
MEQQFYLLKKPLSNYLVILLLVVVGFVLYTNSFSNQMFWDDDDGILKNQYIQNWQYFPKYFSENLIAGAGLLSNYWRPILLTVFSLEWHLWQDWAPGYHFVNTSFHITDAVFLFFILLYIFKNRALAIFTVLVFLVHPLQTEAVTYVSGLGDSLSVFFMFLGILFYLKFRISKKTPLQSISYLLSLLMYILALMSKETAIAMPAFIFIADFFFLDQNEKLSLKDKLKKIGKVIWPFLVISGFYILLRATVLNFKNTFNFYDEENIFTSNFHVRLFTFFRILTIYFGLLFWPFNLHMERTVEIATSLNSFSVIFGGFIFLGLLILAFTKFKRFPILSFGILWFFIGLAPTSNLLIPISGLLYEHWLYLPLIGIFLILFWLGEIVAQKYNLQKILLSLLIIFLVFLSILTINRNKDWQNPITFYNQTLKYTPTSYRVINNLGMAYADRGNHQKAEETYKRAINLDPLNPVAYHNLGNTYRATGKRDLAIENFETAISLDPKFSFSYNALISIYLEEKDYQKAREVLEKYLDYSPSKLDTLFMLAQIAAEEKNYQDSLIYLRRALEIDPKNQLIYSSIIYLENLIKSQK